ncbi:hypothetical protein TSUD_375220 [Trifolium subterraneum]|uniref:Uncharacterized protein n=1 Tax=Trifolium subterraneum TaxID=3900 RepID=A0A2Z6NFN2_TRISU|nr:hypothetical protein TSUD_375220 [Trifolium subterraneum]
MENKATNPIYVMGKPVKGLLMEVVSPKNSLEFFLMVANDNKGEKLNTAIAANSCKCLFSLACFAKLASEWEELPQVVVVSTSPNPYKKERQIKPSVGRGPNFKDSKFTTWVGMSKML